MNGSDRWLELERLYHEALEQHPEARASFIKQACGGDQRLQEELESLLAQDDQDDFLARPAIEVAASALAVSEQEAGAIEPGTLLGPYQVLEQIAQGGMGIVYRAEQQRPVRRKVALKVIKPGMDSDHVIARFQAERQALALMDHPNIARVFDAGTTSSGRLYFVMELVDGLPVSEFCRKYDLDLRRRLALFIPICHAIEHAHQKGVIHRDIKPSNVLVAAFDGVPVPKVIDFGIAKAMQQPLTERSMHTHVGGPIGTFEYMSPEQAGSFGEDIDTRADVYSLGAVLYEMITGSSPLQRATLERAAEADIVRRIMDEDPPVPSVRLGRTRLSGIVRGDLDWVVMKALDKDRVRRYQSAGALARDIERYLNGEAVEAGPASRSYRLSKFARKNRLVLSAAAAFFLLLVLAAALTAWQAVRARTAELAAQKQRDRAVAAEMKARDGERQAQAESARAAAAEAQARQERAAAFAEKGRADNESATAKAVTSFLQDDLLSQADASDQIGPANMQRGPDLTVRVALDRAAQRIGGKFAAQPAVEGAIRKTLGDTYNNLGLYGQAQEQLELAVSLLGRSLGENHPDTLFAIDRLATVYQNEGKLTRAESMMTRELASRRKVLGPDHPRTYESINNLAVLYMRMGRYADAEPYLLQRLDHLRRHPGPDTDALSTALNNLGLLYINQKKFDQAARVLADAVDTRKRDLGPEHPRTLVSMSNLALAQKGLGRLAESIALNRTVLETRRRVLGPEHPSTLRSMQNLAGALISDGQYAEAESLLVNAWQAASRQKSLDPSEANSMAKKLVDLYTQWGKLDQARDWQQKVNSR